MNDFPRWIFKTALSTSDVICSSWFHGTGCHDGQCNTGNGNREQYHYQGEGPMSSVEVFHNLQLSLHEEDEDTRARNLRYSNSLDLTNPWVRPINRNAMVDNNTHELNLLRLEEYWKPMDPSLADDENLTSLSMASSTPIPNEVIVDNDRRLVFISKSQADQKNIIPPRPLSRTATRLGIQASTKKTSTLPFRPKHDEEVGGNLSEAGASTVLSSLGFASVFLTPKEAEDNDDDDSLLSVLEKIPIQRTTSSSARKPPLMQQTTPSGQGEMMRSKAQTNGSEKATTSAIVLASSDDRFPQQDKDNKDPTPPRSQSKTVVTNDSEASTLFSCEELRSAFQEAEMNGTPANIKTNKMRNSPLLDSPRDVPLQHPRVMSPPLLMRHQTINAQKENRDEFHPWYEIDNPNHPRPEGSDCGQGDDNDSCSSSFLVGKALSKWNNKKAAFSPEQPVIQVSPNHVADSSCFTYSVTDAGDGEEESSITGMALEDRPLTFLLKEPEQKDPNRQQFRAEGEEEEDTHVSSCGMYADGSSYSTDYNKHHHRRHRQHRDEPADNDDRRENEQHSNDDDENDDHHDKHVLLGLRKIQLILSTSESYSKDLQSSASKHHANCDSHGCGRAAGDDDRQAAAERGDKLKERRAPLPPPPMIHRSHWTLPVTPRPVPTYHMSWSLNSPRRAASPRLDPEEDEKSI